MDLQVPWHAVGPKPTTHPFGQIHHILTGSFRSLSLYLLAFSVPHEPSTLPISNTTTPHLSLVQSIPAFGPHQYLVRNKAGNRVYATSWASSPILSSWKVNREDSWSVKHLSNVPITAISSYIAFPLSSEDFIYSTGGPCGEVHRILDNGTFGTKVQEFLFNGITSKDLHSDKIDKSRKALRTGSHGIEFASSGEVGKPTLAFIPHLTPSEIVIYTVDESTGLLTDIGTSSIPQRVVDNKLDVWEHDGPRHVKVHPNGKVLYSVTEHSNYLDLYIISYSPSPNLTYHSSRSLFPREARSIHELNTPTTHEYRGDTLMLPPGSKTPSVIFATTRGSVPSTRGWILSASLDEDGFFSSASEWWQTPTSGGKANALDILRQEVDDKLWILLTDDDDSVVDNGGGINVLEWNGFEKGGLKVAASWPCPLDEQGGSDHAGGNMWGGSHAIWLD